MDKDISDFSPKAQELYREIMRGEYLDDGANVPLPMRRYYCQALHAVRAWFEERTQSMRRVGMNSVPAVVAMLEEMEKDPDKLMYYGSYADYRIPEPYLSKLEKKKAKIRQKRGIK